MWSPPLMRVSSHRTLEHCFLGAADRAVDLIGRFAACFRDRRCAELIEHEVVTLVGQRCLR